MEVSLENFYVDMIGAKTVFEKNEFNQRLTILSSDHSHQVDLQNTIGQAADMGAAGVVMWGNRRDENTSPKVCQDINTYIETKLGPYFESVRHSQEECSENKCNGHGRCVDKKLIPSQWISEEPYLYTQTCQGSPRKFDPRIRKDSTLLQQEGTTHVIFL